MTINLSNGFEAIIASVVILMALGATALLIYLVSGSGGEKKE